jgi:hypothetical protein
MRKGERQRRVSGDNDRRDRRGDHRKEGEAGEQVLNGCMTGEKGVGSQKVREAMRKVGRVSQAR